MNGAKRIHQSTNYTVHETVQFLCAIHIRYVGKGDDIPNHQWAQTKNIYEKKQQQQKKKRKRRKNRRRKRRMGRKEKLTKSIHLYQRL